MANRALTGAQQLNLQRLGPFGRGVVVYGIQCLLQLPSGTYSRSNNEGNTRGKPAFARDVSGLPYLNYDVYWEV